ncbi:MAG: hypothetical protein ACR2P2_19015, partial [Nakamurella sp.]
FYLWAAVLSGSAVSLAFLPWTTAIGPAVVLILLAVVVSAWPRVRARRLSRARSPGSPPEITGATP